MFRTLIKSLLKNTTKKELIKMWQDVVMTLGQFIFAVSLIPTILGNEKPAWSTCIMSSIVLTVYIPTLYSLGLYISVIATVLVAIGWWILFFQSIRKNKSQKGDA